LSFIVIPLFNCVENVFPLLRANIDNLKENQKSWLAYEETDEDKEVYKTQAERNGEAKKTNKILTIEEAKSDESSSSDGEQGNNAVRRDRLHSN